LDYSTHCVACGWRAGEEGSRMVRDCKKLTEERP
jgi:hypothetical protein